MFINYCDQFINETGIIGVWEMGLVSKVFAWLSIVMSWREDFWED